MAAMATQLSGDLRPTDLRCEYLTDPIGIHERAPSLSWKVESSVRGARQTAYEIIAASSKANLTPTRADLWRSGKVRSGETLGRPYQGPPLRSRQGVWWAVRVWDGAGRPSAFSRPAFWEMGLLDKSDWNAQWIGLPAPDEPRPKIEQASWIWFPEGEPQKDAPAGKRLFRLRFELPNDGGPKRGIIGLAVDDSFSAQLNGKGLGSGAGWREFTKLDTANLLQPGRNELIIEATNDTSRAGVLVAGSFRDAAGVEHTVFSGADAEASSDGNTWRPAAVLARYGDEPYGKTRWPSPVQPAAHLRKTFDVARAIKRARVYATAKGLYRLYVNGAAVGRTVFAPGWTDYSKRILVQTYDVTDLLRVGRQTIGMVLGDGWYSGNVAWAGREQYGSQPRGLLQLEMEYADGSREVVASDASWLSAPGPIFSSDLVMGEEYDARREFGPPGNWATAAFDSSGWQKAFAERIGHANLVGWPSPGVERLETIAARKVSQPKPGIYVFDLGQNMVGWARVSVKGPAGTKLTLRFAEMLNPDGTIYTENLRRAKATDTYVLRGGGVETYEPTFTFHGFRYVEVAGYPGEPDLEDVSGVVVGTNVPRTGAFATSNKLINQLYQNIFWGQRGNYLEVPTDCPQRDERLGWMGDAQVFVRTAAFNSDVRWFMDKWLTEVRDAQTPEGAFPDVAPKILVTNDGSPGWGDAGAIVPWQLYLMYGDRRLLERSYESMRRWVDYLDKANPDHLWINRRGNDYGDWLNIEAETPKEVLATAYFARSARIVSQAAAVLGRSADSAKYDALYRDIVAAFRKAYVSADGVVKGDTQTGYLLAIQFGLLTPRTRAQATERLLEDIVVKRSGHLSTGFLGVSALAPVLSSVGADDVAYRLLLNESFPSWGYSIKQGATTIWERWDGWTEQKGFQDPGMNSFNHYAFGSVGEWLYANIAGIDSDPTGPGFKKILIRPTPGGGISWTKARYDSVRGRIETSWRVRGKALSLDITIPANTSALVFVPAERAEDVIEGDVQASGSPGVTLARMEPGRAVFRVGGGRYRFRSKMP